MLTFRKKQNKNITIKLSCRSFQNPPNHPERRNDILRDKMNMDAFPHKEAVHASVHTVPQHTHCLHIIINQAAVVALM